MPRRPADATSSSSGTRERPSAVRRFVHELGAPTLAFAMAAATLGLLVTTLPERQWDVPLETLRAVTMTVIFAYLVWYGRARRLGATPGWGLLLAGFGLLALGAVVGISGSFSQLDSLGLLGMTAGQAFVEKYLGFVLGYVLVFLGLIRWLPLVQTARVDALTGLPDRAAIVDRLELDLARSTRRNEPLSLLLIDLDDFKSVNDAHGHLVGDQVLEQTAAAVAGTIRRYVVGRWGGEEFVVILPGAARSESLEVAERCRAAIAGTEASRTLGGVSASIGVAVSRRNGCRPNELFAAADEALYQAKWSGRDRTVYNSQAA